MTYNTEVNTWETNAPHFVYLVTYLLIYYNENDAKPASKQRPVNKPFRFNVLNTPHS